MAAKKQHKKEQVKQAVKVKTVHPKTPVWNYVAGGIALCFIIFYLAVNITASQLVHPIYERMINNDATAWATFFKLSRNEPQFQEYLQLVQGKYREVQSEVNKDNVTRQEKIKKLEEALALNPKSRDVLYALSLLYKESGDEEQAALYLDQARAIDPDIGK